MEARGVEIRFHEGWNKEQMGVEGTRGREEGETGYQTEGRKEEEIGRKEEGHEVGGDGTEGGMGEVEAREWREERRRRDGEGRERREE